MTGDQVIIGDSSLHIPKDQYLQLVRDAEFLQCLKACGVDNWCGYEDAIVMFRDVDQP